MSDEIVQDEFAQNEYEEVTPETQGGAYGGDYHLSNEQEQPQAEEQQTEQSEPQPEPEPEPEPEPVDHLGKISSVHGNLTHATKGRPAARTVGKARRPQTRMPGKAIAVERPPEVKNFDEEPPEEEKEDDSSPARPKTSVMKPMGRGMPGMPAGGFNPAAVKLKAAAPVEKKPEPVQAAPEFLNSVKLRPVTEKPKGLSNQTSIAVSQSAPGAPSGPPKRPPPGPPPGIPGGPPPPVPKGTPPPPIPKGAPPPPIPKGAPPPVPRGASSHPTGDDGTPVSPKGNPVSPRSEEKAKACETCGSKFGILGAAKIHCKNCSKFYCKKCSKKGTNPSAGVTKPIYFCNSCFTQVCPEAQK